MDWKKRKRREEQFSNLLLKILGICADSGANIQASIKNLDCVVKIPCAGHRLDLSVNDIFKEKNITEKIVNGRKVFVVKDFNEEGKFSQL